MAVTVSGDGVYNLGGGAVMRIQGMNKAMRALNRAGAETSDMKELMHSLGELVVKTAKPLTPHKTGRLAGSIRAGRGKTKAVVSAGRKSIPYAGVQHYGWPAHHIKSTMFLVKALEARNEDIVRTLVKGIGEICTKLGLDNNIGGLNV